MPETFKFRNSSNLPKCIHIYTHNFIIMYIHIYIYLRWFRLPASNHSFHHEADLTGTLRKRKRNIIEVEHQMFFLLAQPMYIYIYFWGILFGTPRWLQKGSFLKRYIENRGEFSVAQKSHPWIFYLRQCTCLLDGKVVGQAAKGERFFGGKCDKCPNNSLRANV